MSHFIIEFVSRWVKMEIVLRLLWFKLLFLVREWNKSLIYCSVVWWCDLDWTLCVLQTGKNNYKNNKDTNVAWLHCPISMLLWLIKCHEKSMRGWNVLNIFFASHKWDSSTTVLAFIFCFFNEKTFTNPRHGIKMCWISIHFAGSLGGSSFKGILRQPEWDHTEGKYQNKHVHRCVKGSCNRCSCDCGQRFDHWESHKNILLCWCQCSLLKRFNLMTDCEHSNPAGLSSWDPVSVQSSRNERWRDSIYILTSGK